MMISGSQYSRHLKTNATTRAGKQDSLCLLHDGLPDLTDHVF
jgi:hypothetical protein